MKIEELELEFESDYPEYRLVEVSDGKGGRIKIPSQGFASRDEYKYVFGLIMDSANTEHGTEELADNIVVAMLRFRFPRIKHKSKAEILQFKNGDPMSAPMLMAVYSFFCNELGIPEDKLNFPIGQYELPKVDIEFSPIDYDKSESKNKSKVPPKAA